MDSYVCLETGWTDFLSNERSLFNSIVTAITKINRYFVRGDFRDLPTISLEGFVLVLINSVVNFGRFDN